MTGWTPERVATLRKLWGEDKLVAVIAARLGISPSGVTDKARRLGLERRNGAVKPKAATAAAPAVVSLVPTGADDGRINNALPPGHPHTWLPICMGQAFPAGGLLGMRR